MSDQNAIINNSIIPGPEVGYVDLLDHYTDEKIKESADKQSYFPLRPSSAGKCTKELTYELMEFEGKAKYEKNIREANEQRLLDLGHSIEYHIIQQFYNVPLFKLLYKQQVVKAFTLKRGEKPLLIEGSMDAVFISDHWKGVVDFKSKKDKYSSYYSSNWQETTEKLSQMASVKQLTEKTFYADDLETFLKELNDPFFEANFLQLNLYARSEFLVERGIDHAAIIQYNKNDSRVREVRFRPSQKLADKIKNKYQRVVDAVDSGDGPQSVKRDFKLGSIKCAFCAFNKDCWEGDDALKEYFGTFPKKYWATNIDKVQKDVRTEILRCFEEYKKLEQASQDLSKVEQELVSWLQEANIRKIKFDNDNIYEVKYYKSPREHFQLKRTKN